MKKKDLRRTLLHHMKHNQQFNKQFNTQQLKLNYIQLLAESASFGGRYFNATVQVRNQGKVKIFDQEKILF